jgi:hypothetical protein
MTGQLTEATSAETPTGETAIFLQAVETFAGLRLWLGPATVSRCRHLLGRSASVHRPLFA